jgi:GNAT superfamily N-acetyltransferase
VIDHPGLDLRHVPRPVAPHGEPVVLRDGAQILVRPVEAGDVPLLERGFAQLGALSRYRRFLTPIHHLDRDQIAYLTQVDHVDHEALVAIDPGTGDGIGVARYVRDEHKPDEAEVAIVIIDEWQDRGVGTVLAERLAARGYDAGVRWIKACMLAGDRWPRRLLERFARPVDEHERAGRIELTARLHSGTAEAEHASRATLRGN